MSNSLKKLLTEFKYLEQNSKQKIANNELLIKYFDSFQAFCFDLNPDSILRGDLNFNYK